LVGSGNLDETRSGSVISEISCDLGLCGNFNFVVVGIVADEFRETETTVDVCCGLRNQVGSGSWKEGPSGNVGGNHSGEVGGSGQGSKLVCTRLSRQEQDSVGLCTESNPNSPYS